MDCTDEGVADGRDGALSHTTEPFRVVPRPDNRGNGS